VIGLDAMRPLLSDLLAEASNRKRFLDFMCEIMLGDQVRDDAAEAAAELTRQHITVDR
jgi:hypothetical protein